MSLIGREWWCGTAAEAWVHELNEMFDEDDAMTVIALVQRSFVPLANHQGAVDVLRELAQMPLRATGKDYDRLVKAARELLPEYSAEEAKA